MMEHAADRDVFMRSMAARGELGGLAATTWIAAAALDAAGYDPVLVETVGAGQSEIEVARLAETTVVVEVPEMGDEVQAIKAGLLEVADIQRPSWGQSEAAARPTHDSVRPFAAKRGGGREDKTRPAGETQSAQSLRIEPKAGGSPATAASSGSPLQSPYGLLAWRARRSHHYQLTHGVITSESTTPHIHTLSGVIYF
jgi:hypothetical protein